MRADTWAPIEEVLVECGIRPIVAVVPDNQDPSLVAGPTDLDFWSRVRRWQDMGWAIGLHGYQHCYETRDPGIVGLNHFSEFAGLPESVQERKISNALSLLNAQGVQPKVWVAPGHSFDGVTLGVLKAAGIRTVSDGMFLYPHVDSRGMLWVPQQMWRFRPMPFGVWTVCVHHNSWTDQQASAFCAVLRRYRSRIVSLDDVIELYRSRKESPINLALNPLMGAAVRIKTRAGRG